MSGSVPYDFSTWTESRFNANVRRLPDVCASEERITKSNFMERPHFEILAYEDTDLGPLCLRRRGVLSMPGTVVTEVTLNHEFLMSSFNTDSERQISTRAAELHGGQDLRTLVGGLGLGYTAFELLKLDSVESVDVVEFLPPVAQWLRDGLVPLSKQLNAADNLRIIDGDVYAILAGPPITQYDLIAIDVDHSPSDQLTEQDNGFYSGEGLIAAKQHLRPDGLLAVWSYAESSSFSEALEKSFARVWVEPVKTFNPLVDHWQTDWLFFATDRQDA